MNLPVYFEIKLDLNDPEKIYQDLKNSKAGKSPCFIKIEDLSKDKLKFVLEIIFNQLEQLNIDSKIPYPIYIISNIKLEHPHFSIIQSESMLPSYFKIRIKQPGTKESALIQKIQILSEKIRNYLDEDKKNDLMKYTEYSREIYKSKKQEIFWDELEQACK
jgi:hypothetical protein